MIHTVGTYNLRTGRVSGESATTKDSADYAYGEIKEPEFAVSCPICGNATPVNYMVRGVIVCADCKAAIAWAKKRMEAGRCD